MLWKKGFNSGRITQLPTQRNVDRTDIFGVDGVTVLLRSADGVTAVSWPHKKKTAAQASLRPIQHHNILQKVFSQLYEFDYF